MLPPFSLLRPLIVFYLAHTGLRVCRDSTAAAHAAVTSNFPSAHAALAALHVQRRGMVRFRGGDEATIARWVADWACSCTFATAPLPQAAASHGDLRALLSSWESSKTPVVLRDINMTARHLFAARILRLLATTPTCDDRGGDSGAAGSLQESTPPPSTPAAAPFLGAAPAGP